MTAPDGPHFPLRLQPKHAEQAKTGIAFDQKHGDGPAFDQDWTREDMQDAREAFGTISGKTETWRTVWLTPAQFDALISAVVEYELDANPSGEAWDEFYSEVHEWWDAEPVEGDISETEFWDGLADLADDYQGWTVQGDGPFYAALQLDNAGTGSITVSKDSDGLHEVNVEIYGGTGEEVFSATTAHHHHRHAVLREIRLWFEYAEENAHGWIADSVHSDEQEETDTEESTTTAVEFGGMPAADNAREEWAEYRCPIDDDKRQKTVVFASDTPSDVLDTIRNAADEGLAEAQQESVTADLSDAEREKISDADGFSQKVTVFSWQSAKGVFVREGLGDQFRDAIGSLTDYDDPAEGAESYVRENKQSDAEQGTQSVSGGRRDHGHEEEQTRRKMEDAAAKAQQQGCNHARDVCENGDPDACEFLTEACGYDEEEVDRLLSDNRQDVRADETEQDELVTVGGDGRYPEMDVTPGEAGALRDSWSGYRSATGQLKEAVETVREEVVHARQAWRAIQSIRANHGLDEEHPNRLHDSLEALEGLPEDIPEVLTLDHFARGDHETEDGEEFQGADLEGIDKPGNELVEGLPDLSETETINGWVRQQDPSAIRGMVVWVNPNAEREDFLAVDKTAPDAFLVQRNTGVRGDYDLENIATEPSKEAAVDAATDYMAVHSVGGRHVDVEQSLATSPAPGAERVDLMDRDAGGRSIAPLPEEVGIYELKRGLGVDSPGEIGGATYTTGAAVSYPVVRIQPVGTGNGWAARAFEEVGQRDTDARNLTDTETAPEAKAAAIGFMEGQGETVEVEQSLATSPAPGAERTRPWLPGERFEEYGPTSRAEPYPPGETGPDKYARAGVSPEAEKWSERDNRNAERVNPNERERFRDVVASDTPPWTLQSVKDRAMGTEKAAKAAVTAFDSWGEFADAINGRMMAGRPLSNLGRDIDLLGRKASADLSKAMSPTVARRVGIAANRPETVEYVENRLMGDSEENRDLGDLTNQDYARHVETEQSIGARPMSEGAVGDHRTTTQKAKREQARRQYQSRDVAENQQSFDGFGDSGQQSRLSGGEMGERGQGEVEETTEENPGGLMADERDTDTDPDPTESEQAGLEDVGVTEGLRDADQPGFDEFEDTDE